MRRNSSEFDEFAALGQFIPTALLHLHDPQVYPLWRQDLLPGLEALDDSCQAGLTPRAQYALYRDVMEGLRKWFRVHPLEVGDVVATAVPGMRDILVLGKVKQLEQARAADLIVLDAPAAGHAVSFLLSARGLLDAVKVGPIQRQAAEVVELPFAAR